MRQANAQESPQQRFDRRSSRRGKLLLRGRVVFERGAGSVDCTIRDMSETGARIEVATGTMLPKKFTLMVLRDGTAHEAEVKWCRPKQMGLYFVYSVSLDGLARKHSWII